MWIAYVRHCTYLASPKTNHKRTHLSLGINPVCNETSLSMFSQCSCDKSTHVEYGALLICRNKQKIHAGYCEVT